MTRTVEDFDTQVRGLAHRAVREMADATPLPHRVLTSRRRATVLRPLAGGVALAVGATAVAIAVVMSHVDRTSGGSAELAKSADAIYADAANALAHAKAYRLRLSSTSNAGQSTTAEIRYDTAGNVAESITTSGVTRSFVFIGSDVYANDPDLIPPELAGRVHDRWLKIPPGGLPALTRTYVAPGHISSCLLGSHGRLGKAGTTTVRGLAAIAITAGAAGHGQPAFTVDVATSGAPSPLRLTQTGAGVSTAGPSDCTASSDTNGTGVIGLTGVTTIDLDNFDSLVPITPPPGAIDLTAPPAG